jgi:hypothetical protein
VIGVGQAGHQRRLDPVAASDYQGGGAIGHGADTLADEPVHLGHLVSSLPPLPWWVPLGVGDLWEPASACLAWSGYAT